MLDKDGINRDANGYAYKDGITSRIAREQKVLNESWPFKDAKGRHARGIDDQPAGNQRACLVRVELEQDGEVILPGRATRWNSSHVYVIVNDQRVPRQAVWVRAHDVRPSSAGV
jgi:hypothetical protein